VGIMPRPYITIGLSKPEFERICDSLDITYFGRKNADMNPLWHIFFSKFKDKLLQRIKDKPLVRVPNAETRFRKMRFSE